MVLSEDSVEKDAVDDLQTTDTRREMEKGCFCGEKEKLT
jgi:hypothetical protein